MAGDTSGLGRERRLWRRRRGAAIRVGALLFISLAASFCSTGVARSSDACPVVTQSGLLFSLLEDFGQYRCVEVADGGSEEVTGGRSALTTFFDFTERVPSGERGAGANGTAPDAYDQFIIRFAQYKFAGEHREALNAAVSADGRSLMWVERSSEAAKYTTDFEVVRLLRGEGQAALRAALAGAKGVEGVFQDKTFRSLRQIFPVESDGSNGVFLDLGREFTKYRIDSLYQFELMWKQGFTGSGIKVGIFDTGIGSGESRVRNVKWRSNWTYDRDASDGHGHGTSMAGSVAGVDPACPGPAPDAEIYTFKVFTATSESFTSW